MPFGIDISMDEVKEKIQDFLLQFGGTYLKSYGIAMVNKIMDESGEGEEEKDAHQLLEKSAPPPPSKTGNMKRQTTIRKRMKEHYFWVKDNFELAYAANAEGKEQGTVNLWGYKIQGITQKPEGPRRGGPDWIPDEERDNCVKCDKKFSMIVWHHHCRNCGEVFCSDCASNKSNLNKFGYDTPQRVCDACYVALGGNRQRAETFAVEHQEAKEEDEFHGIRLLHKTRMAYVFQCETLADKNEWMSVMQECANKATPPVNPDPLMGAAFQVAHEKCSIEQGIFGKWQITGTEGEMLSSLLSHVISSSILDPVFENLPDKISPKTRRMASSVINKNVNKLIRTLVAPAWEATVKKAAEKTGVLEEKIKPLLEPIGKAKAEALGKLQEGAEKIIAPILEQLGKLVMNSALEEVLTPFSDAHGALYAAINAKINEIAPKVTDQQSLDLVIENAIASTRGSVGLLSGIHSDLDALATSLKKKQKEVDALKSLPVSDTFRKQLDILHRLARNALHNVQLECKEPTEAAVRAAWQSVSAKLLNDSQLDLIQSVKDALLETVMAPLQEKVMENEAVTGIIEPIDSAIPDAVSEFLSVQGSLEELMENLAGSSVDTLIDASSERATVSLSDKMAALSIA